MFKKYFSLTNARRKFIFDINSIFSGDATIEIDSDNMVSFDFDCGLLFKVLIEDLLFAINNRIVN